MKLQMSAVRKYLVSNSIEILISKKLIFTTYNEANIVFCNRLSKLVGNKGYIMSMEWETVNWHEIGKRFRCHYLQALFTFLGNFS